MYIDAASFLRCSSGEGGFFFLPIKPPNKLPPVDINDAATSGDTICFS